MTAAVTALRMSVFGPDPDPWTNPEIRPGRIAMVNVRTVAKQYEEAN
jgi:hypothetical protein